MSAPPPTWTPLGKKIDLSREVIGNLPPGSGALTNAYSLGTSSDGLPVLEGVDPNEALAFYRLQSGTGCQVTLSSDGTALVITSTLLASGTPGVMLQSVYDPSASGTVNSAVLAQKAPWSGLTGVPTTFPPTLPINESDVTNLVADLAAKVPVARTINTAFSLEGGGALTADLTISLIGDVATPGPEMRYGTDASGVLGWYAASTGAGDMSQSVYDKNHDGIVDIAAAVSAQGVTAAMLAPGVVVSNLGYTPVNKAGDTMSGPLVVQADGPNIYPNMYQQAQVLAQVSPTGAGYPTIALSRQASGGGAVAIWYNSGHQDLNLEYADGTTATLLSNLSKISGSQLINASVPASALASGAAQTNLGYRPVNWNGDTMSGGIFAFQREVGIGASSWSSSPIRIQTSLNGTRPQISFWDQYLGYADVLYLESTDKTLRHEGSDGVNRIIHDDQHSNYQSNGTNLIIQPGAGGLVYGGFVVENGGYIDCVAGSTAYFDGTTLFRSGGVAYIQNGAAMHVQGGGQFILDGSSQAFLAQGYPQNLTVTNESGVGSSGFYSATLYIRSLSGPGRPGIGFHHVAAPGYGAFLYLDTDLKMKFVDHAGTVHVISSS